MTEAEFFAVTGKANDRVPRILADHQGDVETLVAHLEKLCKKTGAPYSSAQAIDTIIPQGHRHNTLLSVAGTMVRRGMCDEAIEAALLQVNARQCQPPLSAEHVFKIVQSTRKWRR
jgi:hypothetical protein